MADSDRWMFVRLFGEMVEENHGVCYAWVCPLKKVSGWSLKEIGKRMGGNFWAVQASLGRR